MRAVSPHIQVLFMMNGSTVAGFKRPFCKGLMSAIAVVGVVLGAVFLEAGEFGAVLAAAEEHHAGDHSSNGHHEAYSFRGDLAFWGGIAFLGFLYSIKALGLWDALLNSMSARERREVEMIATAESALQDAEQELKKARGQLEAFDETTRTFFLEAERDAEYTRNEITRVASREAEAAVQRAEHEIERVRDQSVHDIFQTLVENIARTTETRLRERLTPDDHDRLADGTLGQLTTR